VSRVLVVLRAAGEARDAFCGRCLSGCDSAGYQDVGLIKRRIIDYKKLAEK